MRWLLAALVVLAAVLWWFAREENDPSRQSRETADRPISYKSGAAPKVDREGSGKPTPAPVSEAAEQDPEDDETEVSYVVIRCRDERGTPVPGLTIAVGRRNQMRADTLAPKTNAHGLSTIGWPGKPRTSLRIHVYDGVRHGHEARITATTRRSPKGEPLDLVIVQPVERLVRVLDLDQRPVPNATVTVDPVIPEEVLISAVPGGWKLHTNALGECVVTAGRDLPYRLTAEAEGFTETFVWEWTAPEDNRVTVLELDSARTVTGSVTTVGAGALVQFQGPCHEETRTDSRGHYRISGLVLGEYRVIVTDARGHVRAIRSIVVLDDQRLDPIEARPLVERRFEILDANRNPAQDAYLRFEPGSVIVHADDAGRVRFEAATIGGLWAIVGAQRCGRRWIPITKLSSPIVLPEESVVKLHLVLGSPRPALLVLEYGPPGCPRIIELIDVGDDAPADRLIDGLPPGPLEIDLMGHTKLVNLRPGKATDVHFRVGK